MDSPSSEAAFVALELVTASRTSDCPGCLGRTACWVCQGLGTLVNRDGQAAPCTTCYGGRLCSMCQPLPTQRGTEAAT